MVCSPDGDTDFDIITDVLQGDTVASYLFIICLDHILQTLMDLLKENSFMLKNKKARSRWYLTETIKDTDYADGITLLAIHLPRPNPYYLEQATGDFGLHMNANKTESTCFKWGVFLL